MSLISKLASLNLKTKIIISVLLLSLASIWTLTFFVSKRLEKDMITQIQAQQFSTASYIADSIEGQIKLRLDSLASVASEITPELMANPGKLREFLSQRNVFKTLFRSGLTVLSKEGKGIADYPILPGRSTASFAEQEFFKDTIATLKPAVGKPLIGRFSRTALIAFGVPILDRSGQLIGVLTAATSVSDPALLGTIETTSYQGFPDALLLVSPKYRIVITGSDPSRVMTPTPKTGLNPVSDKFWAGFEGSGISVNSRGIEMLLSAKQIPTPGWFIRVGLPAEIAFAPIKKMKIWAHSLSLVLSILSSLLLWLIIKQTLSPLYAASKLIRDITDKRLPLQKIPVTRDDEVGQLLSSFNKHLDYRKQSEEALQDSEKAAKRLARENELIAEIGRIIGSTLNIEEVYDRFAEKVREFITFDRISVNTVRLQDNTRTIQYVKDYRSAAYRKGEVSSLAGTLIERCVRTKSSILIDGKNREEMIKEAPGISLMRFDSQSSMMIPLISKDEVIGTLAFHSVKIDAFSENDLVLAEKMGTQIAGAIANGQLFLERQQAEKARMNMEERLKRSEKMEALGQLAGGVAHDLNNVLGILIGYSELLLAEITPGNRARTYAEKILLSAERGAGIIQDLLTLARRGVTSADVVNLNSIVSGFIKTPMFEKVKDNHSSVVFQTICDEDLLNIKGSTVHLEKTLMNLVTNAAEAISGIGKVVIRTENRYLDSPISSYDEVKEGDYVVLTVSDTGMGISAEDREKIFEPFYTKKTMGRSGTGLGLAIVWGTVKDHNGYIDLQTEVGRGTTFTLYFPVTRERLTSREQKVPIERYRGHGQSVLVVDDIAEQRDIASELLTKLGYQVHAVPSGEETLEYLKKNRADILVLDMIMTPGIDGLETYQRVLEINPKQRAILVSGFSETDRVKEAQRLGAGAYVKKPYVMERIGMAIQDELDRR